MNTTTTADTTPRLHHSDTWKGEHKGFSFKIAHWGTDSKFREGRGNWNYYVTLFERHTERFEDFWIEPELKEFSIGGSKYLKVDHYNSPLDKDVYWHGGVTYWQGHNAGFKGVRSIEIGCDYNLLDDDGRRDNVGDVLLDCIRTIEDLSEIVTLTQLH